jgi:hypothetical protein
LIFLDKSVNMKLELMKEEHDVSNNGRCDRRIGSV